MQFSPSYKIYFVCFHSLNTERTSLNLPEKVTKNNLNAGLVSESTLNLYSGSESENNLISSEPDLRPENGLNCPEVRKFRHSGIWSFADECSEADDSCR